MIRVIYDTCRSPNASKLGANAAHSNSMGAASSSPSASAPDAKRQGKARTFTCHAFLDAAHDVVVDNSTIKGGGDPTLTVKSKGGKSTKYAVDCICQGSDRSDLQSYYSENLSPIIQNSCAKATDANESSVLLMTIGRKGSGKSAVLYGQNGTSEGSLLRLICQELLEVCSGNDQCQLVVSLIRSDDAGNSQVAHDCLAKNNSASGVLLRSNENAKAAAEIEIKSLEHFDESVLQVGASASKVAHTLLIFKLRSSGGSGGSTKKTIKILDLHGDMPPTTLAKRDGKGKPKGKGSRGGRGGRKGGRGWSSFDTRKAGSVSSDEDSTIRAVCRVIDYLARRFHNVPYEDSLFTNMLRSSFESRPVLNAPNIVTLVCLSGDGAGSGGDAAQSLDFMKKLREITF